MRHMNIKPASLITLIMIVIISFKLPITVRSTRIENNDSQSTARITGQMRSEIKTPVMAKSFSETREPILFAQNSSQQSETPDNILQPSEGIFGQVKFQGYPAADIYLVLRHYDGSSWSTLGSPVITDPLGEYAFTNPPSLTEGEYYYVFFMNGEFGNPEYVDCLSYWYSFLIDAYTAGSLIPGGDFDIADMESSNPPSGSNLALPVTFSWLPRSSTTSDSYSFYLFDPTDNEPDYESSILGYVDHYLLETLPPQFMIGSQYGWFPYIYSPDGGIGVPHYYSEITFSAASATQTPTPTKTVSPTPPSIPPPVSMMSYLPVLIHQIISTPTPTVTLTPPTPVEPAYGDYYGSATLTIWYSESPFGPSQSVSYPQYVHVNIKPPLVGEDGTKESNPFFIEISGNDNLPTPGHFNIRSANLIILNIGIYSTFQYWYYNLFGDSYQGVYQPPLGYDATNFVNAHDVMGVLPFCFTNISPEASIQISFSNNQVNALSAGQLISGDQKQLCETYVERYELTVTASR